MLANNTEQTTSLKTVKNFMAINLAQFSQEKRQQTQVHFYVSLFYFYIYAFSTLSNKSTEFILKQSL